MTSQWQRVDEVLDKAIELPSAQRAAFLDRECDGDLALRREVESLLRAHDGASGFFDSGPVSVAEHLIQNRQSEAMVGRTVGHYQLTREIGRGGMGVVYEAFRADDQFRQKVAIKLLWPGINNSEIARRFRHERQILANLNHPHIARLLDGGVTEDGSPYFAMEFIEGLPITDYCNTRKLPVAERLKLFQQVCSAAQYAHQNLIIHRDLKPGNILVTEDGTAKLLDFGIAKLLDPARYAVTAQPTTHALMMTPEYASPEQMRGEPITTASDVYSLGILLYELLAAEHPYRIKYRSLPELVRVVCEQEPEAPSERLRQKSEAAALFGEGKLERLRSQLSGDLDQITQTAIQKDPNVRYRSVEQLSEDLRRHLSGLPITARTISLSYRTKKFVRRNRVGVLAALLILLTLLGGIVATARQARIAQAERGRAEIQAAEAGRQKSYAEIQAAEALRQKALAEAKSNEAEENSARAEKQQRIAEQQKNLAESQAESNRQLLYASQMNLAGQAWDSNNLGRVRDLVDSHRPQAGQTDLRGFEWNYLWRLVYGNRELFNLSRDEDVWTLAVSPNGKLLATGTDDALIRLWETGTGKEFALLKGHKRHIRSLMFSPDGKLLASGAGDGLVKIWEVGTQRCLVTFEEQDNFVNAVAFSPDGKRLATGGRDGTWRLWEAATGQKLLVVNSKTPWVNTLAFSPDGRTLATGLGGLPSIKLWNAATGELKAMYEGSGSIWSIAFSPDGKTLATGGKDTVAKLWNVETGKELYALRGHGGEIRTLAFSPDGHSVATGSDDRLVKFWEVASGVEFATLKGHDGAVMAVGFSPDGKRFFTGGHQAQIWDTRSTMEFTALKAQIERKGQEAFNSLAFSPDGKMLVTVGTSARIWDVQNGQEIAMLKGHTHTITSVSFSPNGNGVATGSADKLVRIWDSKTGRLLLTFTGHDEIVWSLAFSPDGTKIASSQKGSPDKDVVKVWETATGKELMTLPGRMWATAFSPDGNIIATAYEDPRRPTANAVKLWNATTGREMFSLQGIGALITTVAFTPDGKMLAMGNDNGLITVWDLLNRRKHATFTGHAGIVNSVAFSPEGNRLASGGYDGLVRLWDVGRGVELIAFKGHTHQVTSVAFSPNGQILASTSQDGTVRFWRAATKEEVVARERRQRP